MKNKFNLESKISRGPFIFYGICFVAISSFFKSLIDYTDNLNVLLISLLLGTFFFILTFYITIKREYSWADITINITENIIQINSETTWIRTVIPISTR